MKKLASLLLVLVLALSCCAALAEETYTLYLTKEDLAGNTYHNGFVSAVGMTEMNTVVLKDDGTYEYTKLLGTVNENGEAVEMESDKGAMFFKVCYVYTGTYTRDGDQVTLDVPTECVFAEDWGSLSAAGYLVNSEGTASNGDLVNDKDTEAHDPMANFSTQVYKFGEEIVAVSITVNADGTFSYNAVASSDDD